MGNQQRNRRGLTLAVILLVVANVAVGVSTAGALGRHAELSHARRVCLRQHCACQGSGQGAICIEGGVTDSACTKDSDCGASLRHVDSSPQPQ